MMHFFFKVTHLFRRHLGKTFNLMKTKVFLKKIKMKQIFC